MLVLLCAVRVWVSFSSGFPQDMCVGIVIDCVALLSAGGEATRGAFCEGPFTGRELELGSWRVAGEIEFGNTPPLPQRHRQQRDKFRNMIDSFYVSHIMSFPSPTLPISEGCTEEIAMTRSCGRRRTLIRL